MKSNFANKFKSKKKLVQPLSKWKRRLQAYSISEIALFVFVLGSLYIVNPDFILFRYIRSFFHNVVSGVTTLVRETRVSKAVRGEIHLTRIVDLSALNVQEIFSLLVTLILIFFFLNNIILEHQNTRTKQIAQQKLFDLRLGRSKVTRISGEVFDTQRKAYTRNKVNHLLNSEEYKEKFSVVKKAYDDRRTAANSQNSQVDSNGAANDHELFKPDFFDNQFERIDRELSRERQQRQILNSQRSNQNGPREILQQQ